MNVSIRKGTKTDIPSVLQLIVELAIYEKAPNEVEVTVEELLEDGFGEHPRFKLYVAEKEGAIIGIALYYWKYSTWKGKCLFLEDIVVNEEYRNQGVGSLLFEAVLKEAKELKVKRMEWQVLEWNISAIAFYKKYNAQLDEEWLNGRLTYHQIQEAQLRN